MVALWYPPKIKTCLNVVNADLKFIKITYTRNMSRVFWKYP